MIHTKCLHIISLIIILYFIKLIHYIHYEKKKKKKREVNFHDELKITYFKIIIKYIFEKKNILFKDL